MTRPANSATLVEYLEKPASEEERQIAALLEAAMRAANARDFDALISVYSDDALVMPAFSRRKSHLSKKHYQSHLPQWALRQGTFSLKDVSIRIAPGEKEAEAFGILCALFSRNADGRPKAIGRKFSLKKLSGGWRITEASDNASPLA